MFSDLTSGQRFGLQRSWKVKMAEFWRFCFSIITLNSRDLRQWFYHHCIQLFKTRRIMYNMTQKSQIWNFTSGKGHDLTQIGHVSYHSIRIDKHNGAVLKPVLRFCQKLLAKSEWWPLVTSYGHSWPFEDSPMFFWISNLIYDTNGHNTARTEQICWQLEGLEISPIDLWPDLQSQFSKIRDILIVDTHH